MGGVPKSQKSPSRYLQAGHVAQRVLVAIADHGRELGVVEELGGGVKGSRRARFFYQK